ncbi:MAG: amidohydrolase family protein [Mahellales bacterium]
MEKQLDVIIDEFKQSKGKYEFFDVNFWLTATALRTFYPITNVEMLVSEMKKHAIEKAVVTNSECIEYDPFKGNKDLLECIKDYDKLYGGIVVAPELSFGERVIADYMDQMIENKVVVVRMFPKRLNHTMSKWSVGEILKYMEHRRLPLMLWHTEVNWDIVDGICNEYKELPVIIEGNDQKLLYHNRSFIPLLLKHKNLYIETHNFIFYNGFEYMVNDLKIDRFIFGSYFPFNDPNASMMTITHGDIDEDVKFKIAGRNLQTLIDNIR